MGCPAQGQISYTKLLMVFYRGLFIAARPTASVNLAVIRRPSAAIMRQIEASCSRIFPTPRREEAALHRRVEQPERAEHNLFAGLRGPQAVLEH